jgi:nitrite reductase/ring-hydroxylating ferredoxin subunit
MTKTKIANVADVNGVTKANVNGKKIIISKINGKHCAIENKCPHLGLPLAKGKVENGVITCPFHGSKFDLCSGKNVEWVNSVMGIPAPNWAQKLIAAGKAPSNVQSFSVAQEGEELFIDI